MTQMRRICNKRLELISATGSAWGLLVAQPAAAAAQAAAVEPTADGIAAAQSAVSAQGPGGRYERMPLRVRVVAEFTSIVRLEALTGFGATAGLTAFMLKAAVGIQIVILG